MQTYIKAIAQDFFGNKNKWSIIYTSLFVLGFCIGAIGALMYLIKNR